MEPLIIAVLPVTFVAAVANTTGLLTTKTTALSAAVSQLPTLGDSNFMV